MPTYFVAGEVVNIDDSTKIAVKTAFDSGLGEYVAELHMVEGLFYELHTRRNKLSRVSQPHEWLEGLSLDEEEAERVRNVFQ